MADPGCLSRNSDPDFYHPGSRISDPGSRIPDLGSRIQKTVTKERGEKKIVIILFFSHKFHKIEYYFIFEMPKKKIWANFQRILKFLAKNFQYGILSNIWVWDPGSGKNLFRIPGSKRHRIPDPDPQHWSEVRIRICTKMSRIPTTD